jgi:hypothetical protein
MSRKRVLLTNQVLEDRIKLLQSQHLHLHSPAEEMKRRIKNVIAKETRSQRSEQNHPYINVSLVFAFIIKV